MESRFREILQQVLLGTLLVAMPQTGSSQNEKKDSELQLSFEELGRLEDEAFANDRMNDLDILLARHEEKAKAENNPIELSRSYYYRVIAGEEENALAYADSIVFETRGSDHKSYPTLGYFLKGHVLYNSGKFDLALKNYLQAYDLATSKGNTDQQTEVSLAIAAVRNVMGQHHAAAQLYNNSLKTLTSQEDYEELYYDDLIMLLYNLSLTHLRLFQLDSSQIYIERGLLRSRQKSDTANYRDFSLVKAQVKYYQKDFYGAQKIILEHVNSLEGTSKAIKLYYLGKIAQHLNNSSLAITYFEKVDSIVSIKGDPFFEVKDAYQQLLINTSENKDRRKELEYIEKLIYYDSVLSAEQTGVSNHLALAYDMPFLKKQKEKTLMQIRARNYALGAMAFLAALSIGAGGFFYRKNRRMEEKLKVLLETGSIEKENVENQKSSMTAIPKEIVEDVLNKLEVFEKSDLILKKDLDMYFLAGEFGTNTTYLSMIVNHYKGLSFPNYIKNLKISNAIKQLNENPDLLKYNYEGLASTFGFKSGDSFAKAFVSQSGVSPARFLKELRSRRMTSNL